MDVDSLDTFQRICVLVHNLAHSDILLVLHPDGYDRETTHSEGFIARPKYHFFHTVCQQLTAHFDTHSSNLIPLEYGSESSSDRSHRVGFQFEVPLDIGQWRDFEVRDHPPPNVKKVTPVFVGAVIFPHLGALLPTWVENLNLQRENLELDSPDGSGARHLDFQLRIFLISGPGTARGHRNATEEDNSTEDLAHLVKKFILRFFASKYYLVRIFVSGNVFHFHENVRFIHDNLRPAIGDVRAELASVHGEDWPFFFHVAIALADGTPARTTAIIEGLRQFRPDTIHMTNKNTLWYHYPKINTLWTHDVDFIRHASGNTMCYPAQRVAPSRDESDNPIIFDLIHEMKRWKADLLTSLTDPESEIAKFWLRKSHQVHLAVVHVHKDGRSHYFRGINMEVSMPTGSLCAERNAVGTALSANPTLKRSNFKMVAVLALPKSALESPSTSRRTSQKTGDPLHVVTQMPEMTRQLTMPSDMDPNPRGPCGSCQEWFGKLAETNPNFQVVTFEDESCDSFFVKYFYVSRSP